MSVVQLRRPPYKLIWFSEIDANPQKHWLVENFLGLGELSCVYGMPGSGKSVLAGDLACHVAAGLPWFGRRVHRGAVLYVAAERAGLVQRRFAAWRLHHRQSELPLAVLPMVVNLRDPSGAKLLIDAAADVHNFFGLDVRLIVIDTISRVLAGGDENSPKDMGALVNNLALVHDRTHAHMQGLHHIPIDGQQRMRGHGALLGACDTTVSVEKHDTIRSATIDKQNDGDEGERVTFALEGVELYYDPETKQATTAPVVVPSDAPPPAQRPRPGPKSRADRIMRDAINEALDTTGQDISVRGSPLVRAATVRHVREQFTKRYVVEDDDPKKVADAKRKAFNRALERLHADFSAGESNSDQWIWRT
jgi:hypothetical protein